jgi:hypothetical protein
LEAEGTLSAPIFPLATEFVHHKSSSWPTQHWRLSGPGPEGYVVGRIGLPSSWADFGRFVGALRDQLVLDVLFMTAFPPAAQVSVNTVNAGGVDGADADDDVDMDADDLAELEKRESNQCMQTPQLSQIY